MKAPFQKPKPPDQGPRKSYLEQQFESVIKAFKFPEPIRNMKFYGYYFDFAWPQIRLAVEIDGGTYSGGDHVTGPGYKRMCKKNNIAQLHGWAIMRADKYMVTDDEFVNQVRTLMRKRIKCQLKKRPLF